MRRQHAALGKLVRKSLSSGRIKLDADGIANLKTQLEAWFAGGEALGMSWCDHKPGASWRGLDRHLCEVARRDSRGGLPTYGEVSIGLNRGGNLCVGYPSGEGAHRVGNLDELFALLGLLRERAARARGQEAKRTKVSKLQGAAILARVQHLARTFKFDYRIAETPKGVQLALRLDGRHLVELTVPRATPDDVLLRLEASLPHLLALVKATVSATVVLNHSGSAIKGAWVTHQSLSASE